MIDNQTVLQRNHGTAPLFCLCRSHPTFSERTCCLLTDRCFTSCVIWMWKGTVHTTASKVWRMQHIVYLLAFYYDDMDITLSWGYTCTDKYDLYWSFITDSTRTLLMIYLDNIFCNICVTPVSSRWSSRTAVMSRNVTSGTAGVLLAPQTSWGT